MTWPAWRLHFECGVSLRDLETWYSIDDIVDQNEALDAWQEAKAEANKGPER